MENDDSKLYIEFEFHDSAGRPLAVFTFGVHENGTFELRGVATTQRHADYHLAMVEDENKHRRTPYKRVFQEKNLLNHLFGANVMAFFTDMSKISIWYRRCRSPA